MTIVPDIETPNTDRVSEEEIHENENKVIGGAEYTSADISQSDEKCEYGAAVQTSSFVGKWAIMHPPEIYF